MDQFLSQLAQAGLAIVLGVGGMVAYYFGTNLFIERFSDNVKTRVRPWLFVGPALLVLFAFLVYPAIRTFYLSFTDNNPRTNVEVRLPAGFEEQMQAEMVDRRRGSINEMETVNGFTVIDGRLREGFLTTVGAFVRDLADDNELFYFLYDKGQVQLRHTPGYDEEVLALVSSLGGVIDEDGMRPREGLSFVPFTLNTDQIPALQSGLEAIGGEDAFVASIQAGSRQNFVLDNYRWAFTDSRMLESFGNNLLWLILVPTFSTGLGLLIAILADRVKWESFAKALIFLPMAISFVGASVIWRFIYFYRPEGADQIGLLNAVITSFGGQPIAWLTVPTVNNIALIVILIWIQTGFAMVLLSAALKGVPDETLEAARIDGAGEIRIFFRIIIPQITSTIAVVMTTIIILVLKVFDIPYVMTSGEFGTEVLANVMYVQMFNASNFPRGSVVAVILMIAVLPVMYINIRRFQREEAMR